MSQSLPADACLSVPSEEILGCTRDLQSLASALGAPVLTPAERQRIADGRGVAIESADLCQAAEWLRGAPTAAARAGVSADEVTATCAAATAAEGAAAGAESFAARAAHAALVFGGAVFAAYEALCEALAEELRRPDLDDEERDAIEADLQALREPLAADSARAAEGRQRTIRAEARLADAVEEAEAAAARDLAYLEALRAIEAGAPTAEALRLADEHEAARAAAPPAPRRKRRR